MTADVVIVGGGCMGASVAYHLARRGITNVVLIERESQLGTGSTGRNAGGVRHQFSTPANIALSIESIRMLERFEDEVGFPADLHQDGYLFLLSTPESVAAFQQNVSAQREAGVSVDWLTADEARALAPGLAVDDVLAATFCAKDGIADPNGVTMGLARAAQALGVRIERDTEVTGIGVSSGRVMSVTTTRATIDTSVVVNAAGPYARSIGAMAGVQTPIDPYRRHIFIAPAPQTGTPASRIMVIDFDTTFYFHREGAGVLFGMAPPAGADAPTFDMTVQWDLLPHVIETAVRRLPALADAAISHAWAGLYEVTPDANPIIGASPEVNGLFTIAGFSGHGFQHCPAAGRIVADLIAGHDPKFDLTPFRPDRFASGILSREQSVV
jgi:sarcosine oxidase subunit beta